LNRRVNNRRSNTMNYVYLDNKYNEYLVDDEAYQQIEAIVQASKYCMWPNTYIGDTRGKIAI